MRRRGTSTSGRTAPARRLRRRGRRGAPRASPAPRSRAPSGAAEPTGRTASTAWARGPHAPRPTGRNPNRFGPV
eukprot:5053592-Pyramimonas_sp.AAC.1